jgi:RNA polymerase-binding transcription factor DksA
MDTARYEKILHDRQKELNVRLQKIEDDFEQTPNPDDEDRASERNNDEVLDGLGQAGQEELKAIGAALGRISSGTYGICMNCGNPISPERLAAVPYTPFCQDCVTTL